MRLDLDPTTQLLTQVANQVRAALATLDSTDEPTPIYEADSPSKIWILGQTEYPEDNASHFCLLILYMVFFYALLHLSIHYLCAQFNKRYNKLSKIK